ncbi:two-component system histidine kinase PnpS [Bacillus horti]|uniref:histidine kinase n=1 Tax=Caldalkalibacillus horti TaxID=77523 RepID=A0ABT9VT79_9BACI|nr:ATP-binding protein [Bacillus horti]MDQ0164174.1 two-component system phosphate regulon sensor histidine kinase PhoR [Bacillus horti]
MNKLFSRLTISIIVIIGLTLFFLGYFIWATVLHIVPDGGNYLLIGFSTAFVILSFLVYHFVRRALKPINEVSSLIKDLSEGHYWRRVHSVEADSLLYGLTSFTNNLAQHLQRTTERQFINENRFRALIRYMGSGLLFINQKGKIEITNEKVIDLLQWEENYHDVLYYEAPFPKQIINLIQETLMEDKEIKQHITLESDLNLIEVDLSIAPVNDVEGKIKGVIILFHDITNLKKLEKIRADFVANVSHELKTPLTSIKGFSETLLEGAMYSEEHLKKFLEIIRLESDRLHRLIQDLLHLSHIEQRKFQLKWEDVDIHNVIQNVLLLVDKKADEKHILIEADYDLSQAYIIKADSDRFQQMILNLVSNAIQYTPEQGKITISIQPWKNGKGYKVSVEDTGIGIKTSELPRIFERFYRIDKARSRSSGGTGLGLAIVKHLIEAHHGEIKVSSKEGQGSKFNLFLHIDPQTD